MALLYCYSRRVGPLICDLIIIQEKTRFSNSNSGDIQVGTHVAEMDGTSENRLFQCYVPTSQY